MSPGRSVPTSWSLVMLVAVWAAACGQAPAATQEAPAATQDTPPDAYDGDESPRSRSDQVGTPRLLLSWQSEADDAWRAQPLRAWVENRLPGELQVELSVAALGLGQRVAAVPLGEVVVGGERRIRVDVPLDAIAIQSISAPAQIRLIARYTSADGDRLQAFSPTIDVQVRDDYRAMKAVPQALPELVTTGGHAAEAEAALLAHAMSSPRGRYFHDGAFRDAGSESEQGIRLGAARAFSADAPTPAGLFAQDDALPGIAVEGDDALVDKAARLSRVCVRWRALFIDSDLGEDYLRREEYFYGSTSNAAPYAAYGLLDATSSTWVASGNLNSSGCTPQVNLTDNHNFTMIAIPDMFNGGRNVSIRDFRGSGSWRWYVANFATTTSSSTSITVYSPVDELTNTAAVAARLHQVSGLSLPAGNYTVYTKETCPQGGDACYDPHTGAVFMSDENLAQQSTTYWKFVIGHELGHLAAAKLFGGFKSPGYGATPSATLCACGHVSDPAANSHCLQSSEFYDAAMDEGWGHFFATVLFNNRDANNATFIYYKEFLEPNTGKGRPPPLAKDAADFVRWWDNHCLLRPERAVEYDFLNFYWDLYAASPQISFSDLEDLHERACGGIDCSLQGLITWSSLEQAAAQKWNGGTKWAHVVLAGGAASVDHED